MTTLLPGWLAGVLATLSPCVLPLLPIVPGSAMGQHRLARLAVTGLDRAIEAVVTERLPDRWAALTTSV